MKETTEEKKPAKTVRIHRFQIGLNVLVQIVIAIGIVGMINYLAFQHFKRWDFSSNKKFTLAEQTKRVIKSLDHPVRFIVFFSSASDLAEDVRSLLMEYKNASKKADVDVEFVDMYRDFSRARELATKYNFGSGENIVIVDYDGRSKFVNAQDMADYDTRGMAYGAPPQRTAFKGEQAITSALIAVSEEKKNKIYFVTGHGEFAPEKELEGLKTYVERQNIESATVNLAEIEELPKDASALIIAGAKYDLNDRELKLLENFWQNKGRLMVLLDPTTLTPKLTKFISEQGITPQSDRVLRLVNMGPIAGIDRDAVAVPVEGSPITKRLKDINVQLYTAIQSLAVSPQSSPQAQISAQPVLRAGEGFWGETNFDVNVNAGETLVFDANKDHGPPVIVAASAERGGIADDRMKVDSSRMLVVGNALFLVNEAMTQANLDFFLGGMNWLLDREELTGITPKQPNTFTLDLNEDQLGTLMLLTLAVMPLTAAVIGVAVTLVRRR